MDVATERTVRLKVNGAIHELRIEPRESLLDVLRERLRMTGTKKGCDQGACGACTVLIDGHRMLSCLALAAQFEDQSITTIEGLENAGDLHLIQKLFISHDAFQCGYCTPGQICSAVAITEEWRAGSPSAVTKDLASPRPSLSEEEIKERMSGNLCRCGAYQGICEAIVEFIRDGDAT